jgi:ketosteroid isomerase-like protein
MSPSTVLKAFRETNSIFESEVVAKGNVAALDRVYTSNARILPPGAEMISGRENIKTFWKGAIDTLGVKAVRLETVDIDDLGDTAVEIGRAQLQFGDTSLPPMNVKYVVEWKREDGAWKWHVDIWNPSA